MESQSQLSELLSQWRDGKKSPEEICKDCPDRLDALKKEIEALASIESFLATEDPTSESEPLAIPPNQSNPSSATPQLTVASDEATRTHRQHIASGDEDKRKEFVGRYRLDALLGRGGFGEVWRAFDPQLQQTVALKRPRHDKEISSRHYVMFLQEARKVAALDHPNIVPVFNVSDDETKPFFVAKFIDGMGLDDYLRANTLSHADSAKIVIALAEALHHAHRREVVHRDVKPANILMDKQGKPYLTDFGLAVTEDEQLDEGASVMGTVAYMSTEQAQGKSNLVDGRTDIYSLGIVFYRMLTGRLPYKGRSKKEFLEQIIRREPRPPRAVVDSIPKELETICLKCLAKAPSNRYSTGADLAQDLQQWLDSIPKKSATARRVRVLSVVGSLALLLILWMVFAPPNIAFNSSSGNRENGKSKILKISPKDAIPKKQMIPDPLGWIAKLGQAPRPLAWPGDKRFRGSWHWDNDSLKSLVVTSQDHYFLCLGDVHERDFDMAVEVNRPSWDIGGGGTGIFLGFRTEEVLGEPRAKMQLIYLSRAWNNGRNLLKMRRLSAVINPVTRTAEGADESFPLALPLNRQFGRLSIQVRKGKLAALKWGDRDIADKMQSADLAFEKRFNEADYLGSWGLYNHGTSWFKNLEFRALKGRIDGH